MSQNTATNHRQKPPYFAQFILLVYGYHKAIIKENTANFRRYFAQFNYNISLFGSHETRTGTHILIACYVLLIPTDLIGFAVFLPGFGDPIFSEFSALF